MTTDRILDMTFQIQQIPGPTFAEGKRAKFLVNTFNNHSETLTDIHIDTAGNVLARMPGNGSDAPLVISAHMDTVFPENTDLAAHRVGELYYGPGIGDNSLGVAGILEVFLRLKEEGQQFPGDIWFAANTCEEGLGDLRGMKALVDRFKSRPKAYLIIEGMALGHIYYKGIGVRRYKIQIKGQGGHSWIDFGQPSAIHELGTLIQKITSIKPPVIPHTTFNVGRIGGGTSINTIAAEAWMELDLRSESQDALMQLAKQVESLVEKKPDRRLAADISVIGQRPVGEVSTDHPIIQLARSCLREQGLEPVMTIGSTDANIPFSQGFPALVLGITRGAGAHTLEEYIETTQIEQGMDQLVNFVKRVWQH